MPKLLYGAIAILALQKVSFLFCAIVNDHGEEPVVVTTCERLVATTMCEQPVVTTTSAALDGRSDEPPECESGTLPDNIEMSFFTGSTLLIFLLSFILLVW